MYFVVDDDDDDDDDDHDEVDQNMDFIYNCKTNGSSPQD